MARDRAKPTEGSMQKLKRVCRWVAGQPSLGICMKPTQDRDATTVDVYVDSDWGGINDVNSEGHLKPTSGGIIYTGGMPPRRAQSSAGAEAVSIEVGVSEGIGIQRIMEFLLQRNVDLRVYSDSQAAIRMMKT
eukprot:2061782-Alexandrium_andersonii.AAC.1